MIFKLEFRRPNTEWKVYSYLGMIDLTTHANRLRAQGFEVRCINSIGKDILA